MDNGRRPSGTSFADDFDEFDDLLDDEPTPARGRGATPKAAKASAPKGAGRTQRPSIRITPDWNRVAAVLFVVAVVVFLLYFLVSTIADSRRTGAYKDYFGDVRSIATQSEQQGDELESILAEPNAGTIAERVANIEQLEVRARKLVDRAEALDVPDQLTEAQGWLLTSLEYRASGVDAMQRSLSASVSAKDQTAAAATVSAAMSRLVASDVVWADSFAAVGRGVLKEDEVDGVTVADSVFVSDLDGVGPKAVATMLDRLKQSGPATADAATAKVPKDGKVRGGQLEAGSITVAPSGKTLAPGTLTEITGGENIVFEVPFTNQGEVQLTQVPVKVTIRGEESDTVTLTGTIEVVDPGQTATAQVALDEVPNFGEVLDMDVVVGPIPGEKKTDNNLASYQLQFALT